MVISRSELQCYKSKFSSDEICVKVISLPSTFPSGITSDTRGGEENTKTLCPSISSPSRQVCLTFQGGLGQILRRTWNLRDISYCHKYFRQEVKSRPLAFISDSEYLKVKYCEMAWNKNKYLLCPGVAKLPYILKYSSAALEARAEARCVILRAGVFGFYKARSDKHQ